MKKSLIVAKREFIKVVRKPSFWISTLFLPIFIVVISFISGYSSAQLEERITQESQNANTIMILDKSGYISAQVFNDKFIRIENEDEGIESVKEGEADALFVYSENIAQDKQIKIYSQDKGLLLNETYNNLAGEILKNSILSDVNDIDKISIFNSDLSYNVITYKDGEETNVSISDLLVPGISLIVYFLLTTIAVNFLLLSVSEEKENRVMEIILSTIPSKDLIFGKLIGLIGVIFTQVILLTLLSLAGLAFTSGLLGSQGSSIGSIGEILGTLNISTAQLIGQIVLGVIFTFTGFFILACTMVGVGAASPTYKEAQSLSSIFVIISIFPIYFITILISDPAGDLAKIFSFIPFTASFVLLFRNALGALTPIEIILGIVTLLLYCIIFVTLAFKLFEYGALEYNRRISIKEFFQTFTRKS